MSRERKNTPYIPKFSANDERYKLVAEYLKRKRADKNLTMRQLGDKMGTPHSFIGKVENAERRLDIVEFIDYCNHLDLEPGEAFHQVVSLFK